MGNQISIQAAIQMLSINGKPVVYNTQWPAHDNNRRNRPENQKIDMMVIHTTESKPTPVPVTSALYWFQNPKADASAHYVIDRDGTVYETVPLGKAAYHVAGKALGNKKYPNINNRSIGFEFHRCGAQKHTGEQLFVGMYLAQLLQKCYGIKPEMVFAHFDLDPDRRNDPGKDFPWELYVEKGIASNATRRGNDGRSANNIAEMRAEFDRVAATASKTSNFSVNQLVQTHPEAIQLASDSLNKIKGLMMARDFNIRNLA